MQAFSDTSSSRLIDVSVISAVCIECVCTNVTLPGQQYSILPINQAGLANHLGACLSVMLDRKL